jgi:hypothetical protein
MGCERASARKAFTALFGQPGWPRTLLVGTLLMLVPVVGQIAVQGYSARVLRHVALGRPGAIPPLGRPAELLRDGVGSFVATLIWFLPVNLIVYASIALAALAGLGAYAGYVALAGGPDAASVAIGAALAGLVFAAGLAATIAASRLAVTADALVEVSGRLEYAWKLGLILSYLRLLGSEGRSAFLRTIAGNAAAMACGTLLCGLGVCLAPFLMVVAQAHMQGQLYRIYLGRGGAPLHPADQSV